MEAENCSVVRVRLFFFNGTEREIPDDETPNIVGRNGIVVNYSLGNAQENLTVQFNALNYNTLGVASFNTSVVIQGLRL